MKDHVYVHVSSLVDGLHLAKGLRRTIATSVDLQVEFELECEQDEFYMWQPSFDVIGVAFFQAVEANCTVQSLSLSFAEQSVGDKSFGEAMVQAVKQNKVLRLLRLDLTDTEVKDDTGVALAQAIKENTTLQVQFGGLL